MNARLSIVSMLMLLSTGPLSAQSLFSTRGLGAPVQPVDARGRGVGGVGIGMLGVNSSLLNPAEAAGLLRRGIAATYQPSSGTAEMNGETGKFSGSRFPSVRLILPIRQRFALTMGYATAYQHAWLVESRGEFTFGEDVVETRDVIESKGDINRMEVGIAFTLGTDFAVGLAGSYYTGEVERRITRIFTDAPTPFVPFGQRQRFGLNGAEARVGLRWDPAPIVRVGASLAVSNGLDAAVLEGDGEAAHWTLPTRLALGASGELTPELLAALGLEYAWSNESSPTGDQVSIRRDTWRVGGGIEYLGLNAGSRELPVRLGYAREQLPYYMSDETPADEWSLSFGLGLMLVGTRASPLAAIDAAFERGNRSGLESERNPGGLSESFWRMTFTLSLFGS